MAQAVKTNIVPEGYQKAQLYEGDTMAVVNLREVFIYPQVKFKNKREQAKYNKLVRDVKRTLLKAYLGSFRAGFWNFFAGMFGASLKSEYDPKGKDAMTERVVVLVENGLI